MKTAFAFVALVGGAAASDSCTDNFLAFSDSFASYNTANSEYSVACDTAIPAAQDCYDLATECATDAYKFYEAGSTYMYDAEAQADCYNTLAHCTNYEDEKTADTEKCYTCYRWTLYYDMAVDGPPATETDLDRGCDDGDNDRADCYEWFSADACTQAAEACTQGWDAQCIEGRDAVWQAWNTACKAYDVYRDSCEEDAGSVSVYDACTPGDDECMEVAETALKNCLCDPATDDDCVDYSPIPSVVSTASPNMDQNLNKLPPMFDTTPATEASKPSSDLYTTVASAVGGSVALVAAFAAGRAAAGTKKGYQPI